MEDTLSGRLSAKEKWIRLLYMVLFFLINNFVRMLIAALAIFQFIALLIVGKVNQRLLQFGQSLSQFTYQILRFLTYNTEEKPFPFSDWPSGTEGAAKPKPKPRSKAKPNPKKNSDVNEDK